MAARRKTASWWILGAILVFALSPLFHRNDDPVPRATNTSTSARPSATPTPVQSVPASPGADQSRPAVAGIEAGYVNATSLNVRARPDAEGGVLFKVPRGTRIVPLSRVGDWLEVELNDGTTAWVSADFVSPGEPPKGTPETPTPKAAPLLEPHQEPEPQYDRAKVVQAIIDQSIWATGGSCPCPYNTDRAGRRCGARSAYSKPGGKSPICFPEQVTDGMIQRFISADP